VTTKWGQVPSGNWAGCGQPGAIPYWLSMMVLMALVITNMFIAVVIEGFSESMKDSQRCVSTDS